MFTAPFLLILCLRHIFTNPLFISRFFVNLLISKNVTYWRIDVNIHCRICERVQKTEPSAKRWQSSTNSIQYTAYNIQIHHHGHLTSWCVEAAICMQKVVPDKWHWFHHTISKVDTAVCQSPQNNQTNIVL